MSHFLVAIIGDDPEKQLIPFQENNMDDCPKEYLAFTETESENKEDYENDSTEKVMMPDGRMLNKWDDEFRVEGSFGIGSDTHKVPEHLEITEVPFTKLYPTFEEYMSEWCGYKKRDEKMGFYGYWENPNAKWDWHQLGGRWTGFFKLKTGVNWNREEHIGSPGIMTDPARAGYADQCLKGQVDWEGMMREEGDIANETYNKFVEVTKDLEIPKDWTEVRDSLFPNDLQIAKDYYHKQPFIQALRKADLDPFMDNALHYYCVNNGGRQAFVEKQMAGAITTFAVLKDGKWYERGDMGWWGIVTDEKDKDVWNIEYLKLIENLPDDTLISVYDCHI